MKCLLYEINLLEKTKKVLVINQKKNEKYKFWRE